MCSKIPYKLITFDVTNTLLKFRTSPGQQYAQIASIYGIKADPEELTSAFQLSWKELNATHPNFGINSSLQNSSEWWKVMVSKTFASTGCQLDGERLTAISDHLFKAYSTSACWDTRQGTKDMLTNLKRNNQIALGVISNFDERLYAVLKSTGLLKYFDFVLAAYIVRCYKPQPEIFYLALQHGNCTASEALHIGDDVQLDYFAAKNAGWDSILLMPENKLIGAKQSEELKHVDRKHIINSLEEIKTFAMT